MQRAMASENFSINIFFSNCNLDISIINLVEKKCENFVNVEVTLVKYHYDSNAGFIAWNMLSDTLKFPSFLVEFHTKTKKYCLKTWHYKIRVFACELQIN